MPAARGRTVAELELTTGSERGVDGLQDLGLARWRGDMAQLRGGGATMRVWRLRESLHQLIQGPDQSRAFQRLQLSSGHEQSDVLIARQSQRSQLAVGQPMP